MTQSANADPQIIRREVAQEQGLKRYFTGKPCVWGHVAERYVSSGQCVECDREQVRKAYAADPEKFREQVRKARAADPEKFREYDRKRRAADPEKHREQVCKARAADPEKFREYDRKWRAADPEKAREQVRKRHATPLGQLRFACSTTATRLTLGSLRHSRLKLLGYGPDEYIAHLESTLPVGMTFDDARAAEYHVDHIVPLVVINDALPLDKESRIRAFQMAMDLDNLQLIPGVENLSKSARFHTEEQRGLFDVLCSRYLPKAA